MKVKFNGVESSSKQLSGGGPQGCQMGILEYLSQTSHNLDFIPLKNRYKYIDDASILEVVNLQNVGISSYNIKKHVPSDIPTHNQYISADKLQSKKYINEVKTWTENKKMKLNIDKSKMMI